MYKRNRAPRISLSSLLVTFLLGVIVGGAAVYGVVSGQPSATDAPVEPAPLEALVAAPEESEAEPPQDAADAAVPDEPAPDAPAEPAGPIDGARYLFVSTAGTTLSDAERAFLAEFQPGGVILLGHNIENRNQTVAYVEAIKDAAGMGTGLADLPLIAVDQEGGPVNRLRLRAAPSAAELGSTADMVQVIATAANYAEACRARGIAVCLAPVLDVRDDAGPPSFRQRTFSGDRTEVAERGLVFARALMDGGVLPVAKHYPGHGSTSADSHDGPAALDKSFEELAHIMYPFAEAVARGIPGIMAGHITVTQMDGDAPATMSNRLLRQVLRERWGYDGVILSDDLAMRAITDQYSLEEAAVRALQAGCDALIITETDFDTLQRVATAIERAVEQGILDEEQLRHSQRRLEGWQAWLADPASHTIDIPMPAEAPAPAPEEEEEAPEGQGAELDDEADDDVEAEAEDAPVVVDTPDDAGTEDAFTDEMEPDGAATDAATDESDDEAEEDAEEDEGESTEGLVAIEHRVQQGEWLSRVAVQYGVSTGDLVRWNDLPDDNVRFGTVLTVYLPPERAAQFTGEAADAVEPAPEEPEPAAEAESGEVEESAEEVEEAAESGGESTPEDDSPEETAAVQPEGTRAIVHDVLPGETLTQLGRRYRVGTSDIIAWNELDDTNIRIGQRLTVYVPEDAVFDE